MDQDAISKIIETERFDCNLLFATTALDTGVTFKDQALTNIIVDVTDPVGIIQCIGRKRFIDKSDRLNLYIRARTNQQIGGMLQKLIEQADKVQDFFRHGAVAYNAANGRSNDNFGLVVDTPAAYNDKPLFSKRVNTLKYAQIRQTIQTYQKILRHDRGYIGYVAELLGIDDYVVLENNERKQNLVAYLDSQVGKPMLTKADKEPFIRYLNIRKDRKLCRTYRVIAAWVEDSGLPYRLHEYQTSRIIDGHKKNFRAWELVQLTNH